MTVALSILFTIAVVVGYELYGRRSVWGPVVVLMAQACWAGIIILNATHVVWLPWSACTAIQVWNLVRRNKKLCLQKGNRHALSHESEDGG